MRSKNCPWTSPHTKEIHIQQQQQRVNMIAERESISVSEARFDTQLIHQFFLITHTQFNHIHLLLLILHGNRFIYLFFIYLH